MKKLNIGCGTDIKRGFINLDAVKLPGVDVVHDLNKFKKGEFSNYLRGIAKKLLPPFCLRT